MLDPTLTHSVTGTSAVASTTANFGFTATAGRLLVLVVASDDAKTADPTGYTLPTGCAQLTYLGHYLWFKIAAGTETSVVYTIGSATSSAWAIFEFDNIDTLNPLDTSNGQQAISATGQSAPSYTTPAVTPSTGRRFAVASIGGSYPSGTFSNMTSWLNSYTQVGVTFQNAAATRDIAGVATLVLTGNGSTTTSTGATYVQGFAEARSGMIAVFRVAPDLYEVSDLRAHPKFVMRGRPA